MTPEQRRAAGRLAVRTAAGIVSHVEEWHRGIAARPFRLTSPASAPARAVHDAVSSTVYMAVRGGLLLGGTVVTEAATLAARARPGSPAGSTRAGNVAQASLNAAVGHRLHAARDPLAIRMAVRVNGRDVAPRPEPLAAAFPGATGRLAVFVPGLMETEDAWGARGPAADGRVCFGDLLARDLAYTPIYLRYNTGLHISHNGRLLTELLDDLVRGWPVPVNGVALVGHSMGGLVARSACHYGGQSDASWIGLLHHVVCLGSPHLGAPMERGAGYAGWAFAKVAETRALARLMGERSPGIKDLRFGYVVDEDWNDCDPDRCLVDHRTDVSLLCTADHYAVAATLARDARSPSARLVGDLIVPPASAHGRHRRGRHVGFHVERRIHFGGMNHFDLLHHPDVYAAIRSWLGDGRPTAAGR